MPMEVPEQTCPSEQDSMEFDEAGITGQVSMGGEGETGRRVDPGSPESGTMQRRVVDGLVS